MVAASSERHSRRRHSDRPRIKVRVREHGDSSDWSDSSSSSSSSSSSWSSSSSSDESSSSSVSVRPPQAVAYKALPERANCTVDFHNKCKFSPGDVWQGAYPQTNTDLGLSQQSFEFTFGTHNYVVETNALGSNWNRFVITDNYLAVQQFASWPTRVARNCSVNQVAKYSLKWANNCTTAQLDGIIEPCRLRQALYNGLQISLVKPAAVGTAAPCDWLGGTGTYTASYVDRNDTYTHRAQVGTFTFAPNGAVVESGESAVYFYRFAPVAPGRVTVADYGSQDLSQRCMMLTKPTPQQRVAVPITAPYNTTWAAGCGSVKLSSNNDTCLSREHRLNGLTLKRVPVATSKTT